MAERIDELQLFIGSDASSAISQLGNLAKALDSAAASASNMKTAKGQLDAFGSSLSTAAKVDLSTTVTQLERLSNINLNNLRNSGLTTFTRNLKSLISTDMSKFDVSAVTGITDAFKGMANISNIDKGLKSVVSSVSKIATAGDKVKDSADGMKELTPELKKAVDVFANSKAVDENVTSFVGSLAKLASAGDRTGQTSQHLDDLSQAVNRFLQSLANAPQIDSNIATTINGLGNLAQAGAQAGRAMSGVFGGGGGGEGAAVARLGASTFYNSITSSLKGLLNISLKLGGHGASAIGSFLAKLKLIPSQKEGIDRTVLSFTNLLRAVLPFYGIRGLFDWAKESFEAGSSIVELENVIDTAFGNLKKGYKDISGYIYEWAQGTIDTFGVSQIAAERYAGRIMSMFNSSGFDITEGMRNSAAKMTTELIQRAGDIASFYDVTVDEAMTKIQSGLAGMTRPLRSLGINMSVANMQAFALSKGIDAEWQSLDQASQMMLRYEYLMNASQYAAGDFARTSQSAANQVRLLSLNFQQLSATMGQGLVSAVAPVLSWLNALIKRLIQAANAFRIFMWTLFGKPVQAAKGYSDDLAGYLDDASGSAGDLASGAGGASDGLGKAGKAAKALKKQLTVLPFDELNQLAKDTESASSGSGGGGGAGGGGGIGSLGDLGLGDSLFDYDLSGNKLVEGINKWAQKIRRAFMAHDWADMGQQIGRFFNYGIGLIYQALDWNKVGPKIRAFIQPFHSTINSMVYTIDWGLLGRTFARGLNTITKTLRIWINGFNWRQWGQFIADGFNSFLDEWDSEEFGRLLADKFKAAWDFFGGFVRRFDFKKFGKKLKDMVNGAIDELDWSDMGDTLAEFFNGVNDSIIEFFEDGSVVTNISEAFSTFVNSFLKKFDGEKAKQAMSTVKESLKTGLSNAIDGIDKDELKQDFIDLISGLPWNAIGTAISAKCAVDLAKGLFGLLFKAEAMKLIMGIGGGTTASAGTATATAGAAAAGGTVTFGTIVGTTLAIAGITVGAIELGKWLKSKGIGQLNTAGNKANAAKAVSEGQAKNNAALASQGLNAAGYNTQIVKAPQATATSSTSTTTLKANEDTSFRKALVDKLTLLANPVITKYLDSEQTKEYKSNLKTDKAWGDSKAEKKVNAKPTNAYNTVHSNWDRWLTETIVKHANAQKTSAYNGIRTDYYKWLGETVTKMTNAQKTRAYNTVQSDYVHWIGNTALKTADAKSTKEYDLLRRDWDGFSDKWITAYVKADLSGMVKRVQAYDKDRGDYVNVLWTKIDYYAKGGLFNHAAVFGEAGAEAAIPLERKSTMKRIASAIVDSGGGLGNNSNEIADAIAGRILPAIAGMMSEANNRPMNVNATLYTEDNEVLAKAVNRGQRSLDKRYNPVSQFSY